MTRKWAGGGTPASNGNGNGNGNGHGETGAHGTPDGRHAARAVPAEIRVLVADDHPIFLEGLAALIDRESGMAVVARASTGPEAVEAFARARPDVALVDLRMPGLDGVEVVSAVRARDPSARLVILSAYAVDEDVYRALRAGVRGYLVKDMDREAVVDCVRAVSEGRTVIPPEIAAKLAERVTTVDLTSRERQVLGEVAKGKGNREIGVNLRVTEGTIKVHVNNILAKLGVGSRTEAVTLALRRGLVRLDD